MATAALTNSEPQVVPLFEVDPASLDPLFEEQREEWLRLLGWDYSAPSRSIRDVLADGDLSGFAALVNGQAVGFCFYVIEGARASIGDIYVSTEWRSTGADRLMAAAMLEEIERLPRLSRIESQCVSIDNRGADEVFKSGGFTHHDRYYMTLRFDSVGEISHTPGALDIELRVWEEEDFDEASRVIYASYHGGSDARINSQYASEDGCAELLAILTGHVWCGDFLPEASRIARVRDTGVMAGVLVASQIATRSGHLSQISVRPAFHGLGVGRRMIESSLDHFTALDFSAVSLAVTAGNARAVRLYENCGFRTVHTFPVFYRERKRARE